VNPTVRAFALLAAGALARTAGAQEVERCSWASDRQANVQNARGQYDTFFGGNVLMRCPVKQLTLRADSVESYANDGRVYVIGNVHYTEPRFTVDSDFLTYYQLDERIVASGNVHAAMPNGSTLRGPAAEYFRVMPGTRPAARLVATGRPTINVVQRDSTGEETPPLVVVANTIHTVGDSLIYAGGSVVATKEDLEATGDSMALDNTRETLRMMRSPVIQARNDRPFTLSGKVIDLFSRERKLDRVIAQGTAKAVSEDMTLTSDTIDLRVREDLLERAMAWGTSRASASSATQHLVSDSIDVVMPRQRVREMHAVRTAVAESRPDSTRFRPDTVDWLRGDTIVAFFDSSETRDTSKSPQVKQLLARGDAKSYYQLAAADSAERRPAINYVFGREIVIDFDSQQVSRVTVHEQKGGVYLEPRPVASPDSVAATPQPPGTPALVPPTLSSPATGALPASTGTAPRPPSTPRPIARPPR
jgi:hypothetical protein